MNRALGFLPVALGIAGCAQTATPPSVDYAGITHFEATPVLGPDGAPAATRYRLVGGKEMEEVRVSITWADDGQPQKVLVSARGLAAFRGQAVAAEAVVAVQKELTRLAGEITPAARDAILAALTGAIPLAPTQEGAPGEPDG